MSARDSHIQVAGIVLAGAHPWNHSAFDRLTLRALLPIAHRPLISYALSWLRDGGIRDVAVCANRETRVLESRLHGHVPAGMSVSYHEDAMPRGAAGAARDAAAASDADVFVVVDATAIPTTDLADLLRTHARSGSTATMVVHTEPSHHGLQAVQVPTGVYVFNREALGHVPRSGFYDLKENLVSRLHKGGERVSGYTVADASPRVLDAASYLAVNEWMVEHLLAAGDLDGYFRSGTCLVHRDAEIASDVMCVGPVLVGPGAAILSGAVIVGPTSVGREASIGAGALISRSAIWRRSSILDRAVVDRCIVGDDAVLPSGAQLFGQVMSGRLRHNNRLVQSPSNSAEAPPRELFRRVSRALLGRSRLPAAQ